MEMSGINSLNPMNPMNALGLNHLNMPMNSFMMPHNGSLLNHLMQSGMNAMHQGWAGGLSGKMVSQLWMNDESKVINQNFLVSIH